MIRFLRERKFLLFRNIKNYGKLTLRRLLLSKVFQFLFKIVATCSITGVIFYAAYLYINTSVGDDVVVSKSEIIARVGKLTTVPKEEPDAVVRVEDPDTLKKQNAFYENVKIGDYILIYPNEAIVYDLMNNSIISEKKIEK